MYKQLKFHSVMKSKKKKLNTTNVQHAQWKKILPYWE